MMMVNIHAAKTHLSSLIEKACSGEEVVIARDGEPMVKLTPVASPKVERKPGSLKGKLVVPDSFFDPLPDDELSAWEQ